MAKKKKAGKPAQAEKTTAKKSDLNSYLRGLPKWAKKHPHASLPVTKEEIISRFDEVEYKNSIPAILKTHYGIEQPIEKNEEVLEAPAEQTEPETIAEPEKAEVEPKAEKAVKEDKPKKVSQKQQVLDVVNKLRVCSVKQIMAELDTSEWKTLTPEASVRLYVQRTQGITKVDKGIFASDDATDQEIEERILAKVSSKKKVNTKAPSEVELEKTA